MNEVILSGMFRNVQHSHTINNIEYDKADIVVARKNGVEDVLPLKFKKFSNKYTEGQNIELTGNLRSYSTRRPDGTNKVELYVFTYFDIPQTDEQDHIITNSVRISGRVCKVDMLRIDSKGKESVHFILANNIQINKTGTKIDTYIPCICVDATAQSAEELHVGDAIEIRGELHSNVYKKYLPNGEMELRTAHTVFVTGFVRI